MSAPELVEGPRVLGLGLGLFLLILMWSVVAFVVLVCSRLSLAAGVALASLALAVTAVLLAVPRKPPVYVGGDDDEDDSDGGDLNIDDFRVYDTVVIWKIVLAVTMSAFLVGGLACFLCGHGAEGVYPQQVRKMAPAATASTF